MHRRSEPTARRNPGKRPVSGWLGGLFLMAAWSGVAAGTTGAGAEAREALGVGGGVWWWPYFMALFLGLGPLAGGLALGRWLRVRGRPQPWLGRASLGSILLAVPVALGLASGAPHLSTWDIIWVCLFVATGFAVGASEAVSRMGTREVALVLGAAVGAVLIGEVVVRFALPAPPGYPPISEARLTFTAEERERSCRALYPEAFPGGVADTLRRRAGEGAVLHVGDSMVFGTSVRPEETFTAILDRTDGRAAHLNAGQPGTGTDYHSVLLDVLLKVAPVRHVVLYVYPANDLLDLDKPYACCQHGPLLDQGEPRPAWRCPGPGWEFPLRTLMARGPPPYPWRVATAFSALAAHGCRVFSRLTAQLEPALGKASGGRPTDSSWQRFTSLLGRIQHTVAQRGARLTVVVLPDRGAIEAMSRGPNHERATHLALVQASRDLGIETLDAWEPVSRAVQAADTTVVYSSEGGWDEHFSAEGHALMARWLRPLLAGSTGGGGARPVE